MFLHLIINIFLVSKLFALQQFINKNFRHLVHLYKIFNID